MRKPIHKPIHKQLTSLVLLCALCASPLAMAKKDKKDKTTIDEEGRVHIVWQAHNKYRDVRPSNQSSSRFKQHVFSELDEKFEELAETLPEGHVMKLVVTDLDLAGEVFLGGLSASLVFGFGGPANDIRVVERNYIPRIKFSYSVVDSENNEVLMGEESLKDLGFFERRRLSNFERPFVYEKRMLTRWYERNIEPEFTETLAKR